MPQTNKSSDSQQEDQHQLNFISPIVNSDDKTGGKKNSNAGDSCKEPAENLAINAKEAKSSPQRERWNKQKKKSGKYVYKICM